MFDGFWSGIFGGLFGPAIAQWLSGFKYWMIFLFTVFAWQLSGAITVVNREYVIIQSLGDIQQPETDQR